MKDLSFQNPKKVEQICLANFVFKKNWIVNVRHFAKVRVRLGETCIRDLIADVSFQPYVIFGILSFVHSLFVLCRAFCWVPKSNNNDNYKRKGKNNQRRMNAGKSYITPCSRLISCCKTFCSVLENLYGFISTGSDLGLVFLLILGLRSWLGLGWGSG